MKHPSVFIFTDNTRNIKTMSHHQTQRPGTNLRKTGVIQHHGVEDQIGPCSKYWSTLQEGTEQTVLKRFLQCVLTQRHQKKLGWMERTGCLTAESLSGAQLGQPSDYFQLKMTLKFNSHLNFDGDTSLAKNILKKDPFLSVYYTVEISSIGWIMDSFLSVEHYVTVQV